MKKTVRTLRLWIMALIGLSFSLGSALAEDTLAVRWNGVLLESVRNSRLGPPMVARALAVVHTCGFDAWAAYDDVALGTQLGGSLRRPAAERTAENAEKAYSYAEYRCLLDLFPTQADFIRTQMSAFGFDPDDASVDPATPQGVGNLAAAAILEFRHQDGSNQLGDLNPVPYSDYTGYLPVNDPDHINDPNRWQPLRFSDGQGGFVVPGFVGPHWQNVVPFALESASQFRPGPPQRWPSLGYLAQSLEEIVFNATLNDRGKMIAEYWADGPRSELPPGHWTLFAEFVSRRDGHTFDQDVQMFFLLGNAVFDAGIGCWDTKRLLRLAAADHVDPLPLPWTECPEHRAVRGREAGQGRGLAAVSAPHFHYAPVRRVHVGPQHVLGGRGRGPEAFQGKRRARRVGDIRARHGPPRARVRASPRDDPLVGHVLGGRGRGRLCPGASVASTISKGTCGVARWDARSAARSGRRRRPTSRAIRRPPRAATATATVARTENRRRGPGRIPGPPRQRSSRKRSSVHGSPRMWYPLTSQKPARSSATSSRPLAHLAPFQK